MIRKQTYTSRSLLKTCFNVWNESVYFKQTSRPLEPCSADDEQCGPCSLLMYLNVCYFFFFLKYSLWFRGSTSLVIICSPPKRWASWPAAFFVLLFLFSCLVIKQPPGKCLLADVCITPLATERSREFPFDHLFHRFGLKCLVSTL